MSVKQRTDIHRGIIGNTHWLQPWNPQQLLRRIPQSIMRPQRLLRIIHHQALTRSVSDGMHNHPSQRRARHRALVSRAQERGRYGLLGHDAVFQSVQHFVHEQWDLAAVREQPQVDDELAVGFLVVVVGDAARVEPGDEALECPGSLGVQSDGIVFRRCPPAAESGFEVSGVECHESVVDVEDAFVVVASDDDSGLRAVG